MAGGYEMVKTGLTTGEVVWYNDRRGYGFVRLEDDEIFIHRSVLVRFGLNFLYSGDEITVQIVEGPDGPFIQDIRAVSRKAPESLPKDTPPKQDEVRGIVKFFNPLKGYGFISVEDQPNMSDVFIHSRTLQACGLRTIAEGQPLLLHISDDGKGPQATEVRILAVD